MANEQNSLRIPETLRKVKNIIGIFSAKGGVGKSAISLNLALALKDQGFKVFGLSSKACHTKPLSQI